MKLAALGAITVAIGLVLGESGLIVIGALWVLLGPAMRRYGLKLASLKDANGKPTVDARTFSYGTLLWLALGVPSLLVGLFTWGISAEHDGWRWLPIVVGGFALVIGGVGGVLYALGSAVEAKAGTPATVPATIRIRSAKETGTFINERPRLKLELTVEPESGSPYEVTKLATVPFTALGSVKAGGGFKALVVGPEEPTTMEIHWDQPADGSGDASARLEELDRLHQAGKVTDEEYAAQRQRILGSI
ncbi:hypothetical protein GCM10022234_26340 [Aeromicrobium panaciterrae]|uniref:SHOCT domain-containing protein n=1 Tax=Aeromicrobium panaciterrae TaxID=363861 RepID=UPI0031DB02FA